MSPAGKTKEQNVESPLVGILADSHGSAESIEAAVHFLLGKNCDIIFHLGDICDSYRPETADECVRILRENRIRAIKGNNDYAILLNRDRVLIKDTTREYLESLPLMREWRQSALVHSLPFVEELGLSAMIGIVRNRIAKRFFSESGKKILFRGHSHSPQILRQVKGKVLQSDICKGERIALREIEPCIITCGALTEGLCMIWNPKDASLVSLPFS